MGSISSVVAHFAPARMLFAAIVISFSGIALLLAFIIGRRWKRSRYFARRDALACYFRQHWPEFVGGTMPTEMLKSDPLAAEVLETILLDAIEVAKPYDLPALIDCLRRSGTLDRRIREARATEGWQKQAALVVLGRTRAPEAIPALAEALESSETETRIAAVRGLGKVAQPTAAAPILERFTAGQLEVSWGVLKNALLSCCRNHAEVLTHYVRIVSNDRRELLARVLAEVADNASCDELLIMVTDTSPELRASAARGLGRVSADVALAPLCELARDREWFVRLRAVVALGSFVEDGALLVLVRALTDRNRMVRQRAAWALIRSHRLVPDVIREVVDAGDNYGLQAVVAELDVCGLYTMVIDRLRGSAGDSGRLVSALEWARSQLAPKSEPVAESKPEVCIA